MCAKCSAYSAVHPEFKGKKRICDACHSELIKETVINSYKTDIERLSFEITNLEKKYETELFISEKNKQSIETLQKIIEDSKIEAFNRDVQLNTEIDELEQEMLKIHSEYEEILACTEKILIQNSEFDCKIEFLITQNQEFTKDPREVVQKIYDMQAEVESFESKTDEKGFSLRKLDIRINEAKIAKVKAEILALKEQRTKIANSIVELKESENIKESNISLLLTTLSNTSTKTDWNFKSSSIEDEETVRLQDRKIYKLKKKVSKTIRKNQIVNNKCNCQVF